ncbi:kinase-like domain-containing protein [Chytriomyces sp. MP71]|nr:kinase-like domain-containing protein [Chytriomyces sp. MP71]
MEDAPRDPASARADPARSIPAHILIRHADLAEWSEIKSGAFGVLHKADYLGTDVAVKTFLDITKQEPAFDLKKYIEREVEMLKDARHPNIVQFMGCSVSEGQILLVTEFVPGGNVKEWLLDAERPMSDRTRITIAMDVAKAMAYLHSRGIIHRDLKSENLLVTEYKRIKVCDFGFSRPKPNTPQDVRRLSFCGTDSHMAPEIMLCIPFDHRVDLFSYGVILCELAMGRPAEAGVLERVVPGLGISQEEVRAGVRARGAGSNGGGGIDREADIEDEGDGEVIQECVMCELGPVIAGYVDLALQCAHEDASERPEWKLVMKKLKELDMEAIKVDRELGLITDTSLVASVSLPSMASFISAPGSRIAGDRAASIPVLGAISETDDADVPFMPPVACSAGGTEPASENRESFTYNRLLEPFSSCDTQLEVQEHSKRNLTRSDGDLMGRLSKSSTKLSGCGLQHSIPHKLDELNGFKLINAILKGRKCEVCDDSFLKLGGRFKSTKCNECGAIYHTLCQRNAPQSCGLPRDLRKSLFPANPALKSSTSTLNLTKSKSYNSFKGSRASTPKGMPKVFHGYDGDHVPTQQFSDAVNPDIHPPTPPVSQKKKFLGKRFSSVESSFSVGLPLSKQPVQSEAKPYIVQFHDLRSNSGQNRRALGSTRDSGDLGTKAQPEFDSRATLKMGDTRNNLTG